jgi:hypothetical protein
LCFRRLQQDGREAEQITFFLRGPFILMVQEGTDTYDEALRLRRLSNLFRNYSNAPPPSPYPRRNDRNRIKTGGFIGTFAP